MKITYFEKEGEDYTGELVAAVKERLDQCEDINNIVIASATGKSALKLYDAIDGDAEIINVTHHSGFKEENTLDISDEMLDELDEKGIVTFIGCHAFSGANRGVTNKYGGFAPLDIVSDSLRMISHGVKVAWE